MRRLLFQLHALSSHCAVLPLVAGLMLLGAARVEGVVREPPAPPRVEVSAAVSPDRALIDSVLAKRAPELGVTLRSQVGGAIAEEAREAGYDPLLVLAIIDVESEFDEGAISPRGARGLMQIRPSTLQFIIERAGLRLSPEEVSADPALCVRLGIRYLRSLQDRFGGDLELALMAYNGGPDRIRQAFRARDLDAFRFYPRRVKRQFVRFRTGAGLAGDWALAQRER